MKRNLLFLIMFGFVFIIKANNNENKYLSESSTVLPNLSSIKKGSLKRMADGFNWIPYEEDGCIGAMDLQDNVIVPAFYQSIKYNNGFFIAKDNQSHHSIFLKTGELFIPANNIINVIYNEKIKDSPFVFITDQAKWFAVSVDGKILVPEDIYSFVNIEGDDGDWYLRVGKDGYQSIIDEKGKVIIPLNKYNWVTRHGNKKYGITYLFGVYGSEKGSGVCDEQGNELIRSKAYYTYDDGPNRFRGVFGGTHLTLEKNGELSEMNKRQKKANGRGEIKINDRIYEVVITPDGYCGIKSNGELIIPTVFDNITLGKKHFLVTKGLFMGAYDTQGRCVVPIKYTAIGEMDDFFTARKDGLESCISLNGKEISPLDALFAHLEINGKDTILAKKSKDTYKWAIFSKENKMITPFIYSDLCFLKDNESGETAGYCVFNNGKIGVCNKNGKEIIEPLYRAASIIGQKNKKFIRVRNGNKTGVYNMNGEIIIPAEIFEEIEYSDKKLIATGDDRKCVFNLNGKLLSDSHPKTERDNYIRMADKEFDQSNWKKAADYYGKALEYSQEASLYYNRGVSYYNYNKYKNAIENFISCLEHKPSQNLIDNSKAFIAKARQLQAEKIERRQAIAYNVLGLVVGAIGAYAQTRINQSNMTNINLDNGTFQRDKSLDYLLDPNYAMQQVKIENWREYLTMTNGGKTMSYEEWQALKAQAMMASSNSDTSNAAYSSPSNSNSSNKVYASDCRLCYGTGNCRTCDGRGFYYNSFDLTKTVSCPNCYNHNGKCSSCGGTGKK